MVQYQYLLIERKKHKVAVINILCQPSRNMLNSDLILELTRACKELNEDDKINCVILTGEKDVFLAGADIKEMTGMSVSQALEIAGKMKALQLSIIQSTKPYIAAINGYCLGGGMELALVCDFRVAGHDAIFALPQVNLGIIPGGGGISRLTEVAGRTAACKMILTGEMIPASKALELTIISDLFEDPLSGAILIGNSLASKSKMAIATAKKLLNQKYWQLNHGHFDQEMQSFALLFDYPDSVEGMGAFLEHREPTFRD
jgi:enoyl-CoA hydratase/carnithine racemase